MRALLLIALLGFMGCSKSPQVAGATSETTNGDIKAVVVNADGTAAARVRVAVIDDEDWIGKVGEGRSMVLDSTLTNEKGEFLIQAPKLHRFNLQIDGAAEGLLLRSPNALILSAGTQNIPQVKLLAYGSVSGSLQSDFGSTKELRLAGTSYAAVIRTDSGYTFDKVPAGSFAMVALILSQGISQTQMTNSIDILSGVALTEVDLGVKENRILIDDFELGWNQTSIGRILGDGLWYTGTDIVAKGNSSIKVDLVSDSSAHSGSSVKAEYILGTKLHSPYTTMGLHIGRSLNGSSYDFSNLTALSFWAKGQGSISIRFLSKIISTQFTDSAHYFYVLKLPSQWTHITIPVDSIQLPTWASAEIKSHPWAEISKQMQNIDFTVQYPHNVHGDTAVLWLDEVFIEGVSLQDLVP